MGREILLAAGIFTALTPVPGLAGEASQPGAGQPASDRGVLVAEAFNAGRPHPSSVEPQQLAMEPVTEADAIHALIIENRELKARLERLEALVQSQIAAMESDEAPEDKVPQGLVPKKGVYVQADIGFSSREFAGENGITNLTFDPALFGSVALGYRYDNNFRFSFEYSSTTNAVDKIRPGVPIPVEDSVIGPVGANGAQFDANGDVRLDTYTLNAYYDLPGFGPDKRFRPYLGAGIGFMRSKISGLQPAFFPSVGTDRTLDASDTQPVITFEAGLSYLISERAEVYMGGEYMYTSTFLFEDTSFGTLMPNGARSWVLKTGGRFTF